MELLLGKRASIEARAKFRNTPLHLATICCNTGAVKLLLSKGASIGARNIFGMTPLHVAKLGDNIAKLDGNTDAIQLLKNRAAELAQENSA